MPLLESRSGLALDLTRYAPSLLSFITAGRWAVNVGDVQIKRALGKRLPKSRALCKLSKCRSPRSTRLPIPSRASCKEGGAKAIGAFLRTQKRVLAPSP